MATSELATRVANARMEYRTRCEIVSRIQTLLKNARKEERLALKTQDKVLQQRARNKVEDLVEILDEFAEFRDEARKERFYAETKYILTWGRLAPSSLGNDTDLCEERVEEQLFEIEVMVSRG